MQSDLISALEALEEPTASWHESEQDKQMHNQFVRGWNQGVTDATLAVIEYFKPQGKLAREQLMDEDGENKAVRWFLAVYGCQTCDVETMRKHLERSGFPYWPSWVKEGDRNHLTKAGAQLWLRYLFELEKYYGQA